MKTYLAFLKGINVGGHHKILMKDLRDLLNNLGFKDVKTYIQSGNVIFKTEIKGIYRVQFSKDCVVKMQKQRGETKTKRDPRSYLYVWTGCIQ